MSDALKIEHGECKTNLKKKIKRQRRRRKHNQQQQQRKANTSNPHRQRNSRQHRRKKCDTHKNSNTHDPSSFTHSSAVVVWRKTYETMVKWHQEHQMNYWRGLAERRKVEIDNMRTELDKLKTNLNCLTKEHVEMTGEHKVQVIDVRCSSVQDTIVADEKPNFHEPYLEFMEITERHRIDLAQQRLLSENED